MSNKHVTTQKGLALLAKQQAGGALPNITRVVAGAGYIDPALLDQQTEVLEPIAEMEVGNRQLVDGKIVRLPVQLSNMHLTDTAMIRQIGVYSQDPDEGEILYQIVQYEYPVPLPTYAANNGGVILFEPELDLMFSNGELAEIPSTPEFLVTRERLQQEIAPVWTGLNNKVEKSEGWKQFGIEYVNGISAAHGDPLRYYVQGNVVVIGGSVSIVTSTLNNFTAIADLTVPFQLSESILINCTGAIRGASGAYQDHQRALRLQTKDGSIFPTNELTLVATRPISNDYSGPNGATTPYNFVISGVGAWPVQL